MCLAINPVAPVTKTDILNYLIVFGSIALAEIQVPASCWALYPGYIQRVIVFRRNALVIILGAHLMNRGCPIRKVRSFNSMLRPPLFVISDDISTR